MKKCYFAFLLCGLALVGCTPQERKDIIDDIGNYAGAPPDATPDEVAKEVTKDVLEKASNPLELAYYLGAGAVTVGLAYLNRKYIKGAYKKVTGAPKE